MTKTARPQPLSRADYVYFSPVQTRWEDNDIYGHINNAVYYSYFDSAVNTYLIEQEALNPIDGEQVGLVVSSACDYFAELAYPQRLDVGLRVGHLGRSSVRYELAIFAENETHAAAQGHFTHVFVDRVTRSPQEFSNNLHSALIKLVRDCLAAK